MMDGTDSRPGQLQALLATIPKGTPIVMVNMLKFRDKAHYDDGPSERSGRDAYALYSRGALDHVTRAGGEVVWFGKAYTAVIAPPGEAWDEIFMVRYPSIEAFMEMIESPGYREILVHRAAALKDSRLIPVIEQKARPAKPTAPSIGPSGKTVK